MKAVFYNEHGAADVLTHGELDMPPLAANQVMVKLVACAVNPIDRRLRGGELQEYISRTFPVVPGWDFSGVICEVGDEVNEWQVGDEVMGLAFTWSIQHGTYAEYCPVDATSICKKPASLSFYQAASLPLVSLTAWQALSEFGQLSAGQAVLVQAGAGGVGSVAVPMAKLLGAKVYSTCSTANASYVSSLGADVVIDYTQGNYVTQLREVEPNGVDLVLESLYGDQISIDAIGLTKNNGVTVFLNNEPPELDEIAQRGIKTEFLHHRADGAMLAELASMFDDGRLPAPPIEVMPLSEAERAHVKSENGRTRGKVVLEIG